MLVSQATSVHHCSLIPKCPEYAGVARILFLVQSLQCEPNRVHAEAALLLHSTDHDGNTVNSVKEDDIVRDLLLDHGFISLLLYQQTRMAELHQTQPLSQRMLHQSKIQ